MNMLNIPCYDTDKNLFPGSQLSPEEERIDTTFYNDFKIAEAFGFNAIEDTFNRAFGEWKDNIKYVTELAVVVNNLCWEHYQKGNTDDERRFHEKVSRFYSTAYYKCYDYVLQTDEEGHNISPFSSEEIGFFLRVID